MPKVFLRRRVYYFNYKDPSTKKWLRESTGFGIGAEADAQRFADLFVRRIELDGKPAAPTVKSYGEAWIKARKARGVTMAVKDESRLTVWIYPFLGSMRLDEVRPRHVRAFAEKLRAERAERTASHVIGTLRTMFRSAVIDEHVTVSPVLLDRGSAPTKADADPTWRGEAIYTRGEVEQLISDHRIPEDRRVLYALKMLAGGIRHGEVEVVTWAQYDATLLPLGRLRLTDTKTGVARDIPVHPTLATMLAHWRRVGWPTRRDRPPTASDLIVPGPSGDTQDGKYAQAHLVADLELLGLRRHAGAAKRDRRGHDLRRTFVSLAVEDGMDARVAKRISHGAGSSVIELYTTHSWAVLCRELGKLDVHLLDERGERVRPASGHAVLGVGTCTGFSVGTVGIEPSQIGFTPYETARVSGYCADTAPVHAGWTGW